MPGDALEPRGNGVSTHCFVNADHVGNLVNHRSQTGILILVNRAPIIFEERVIHAAPSRRTDLSPPVTR